MDDKSSKPPSRGFWGNLLRSPSLSSNSKTPGNRQTRRVSAGDMPKPRSRPQGPEQAHQQQQQRLERAQRKKVRMRENATKSRPDSPTTPLTEWPPEGISLNEELSYDDALRLIAAGAPSHKGCHKVIAHASEDYYTLYSTTTITQQSTKETDKADLHNSMVELMTLRMQGEGGGVARFPWETLEQPSCSFYYGAISGTITLNHWSYTASNVPERILLRDSGVLPRPIDLEQIFERLKELQAGLEDDDEALLYKILYKRILKDPDRMLSPHKTMERQITDLILVLSRADWIDFTESKNQIVTRSIFDATRDNMAHYHKFYHQLLLSLELELRIHSKQHNDRAKEKLLSQIPPTIQWNLALARRWKEFIRIDAYGIDVEQLKLRYKLKKRQVKMLKKFATAMKWPNLAQTLECLKERDEEFTLDDISSDAFAFFSGLVLPGPTFPFLIMNTLIDIDPDDATNNLALLSHMHPSCGFQYRNSYTYWSATCIVGKVLAPTCQSLAGWIGPARPTADLGRSEIARIRSRPPKHRLRRDDVESMGERSEALGPAAEVYPVREYVLVAPDEDELLDTARIELLSFKPVLPIVRGAADAASNPELFDAVVQFAIDGISWPLRLMYDVVFISAWPCSDGPHPLFFDYIYKLVPVNDIVHVQDWGGFYRKPVLPPSARSTPVPGGFFNSGVSGKGEEMLPEHEEEEVLVIEAMGVHDNEVLARAWCAHWGLNALVADINKTCMACAVRECYAATLTVLILVKNRNLREEDL